MSEGPTILSAKRSLDPDIFGRYCLLERLGQGGMAEIFRARTFDSDNPDAYLVIKRILPNLAEDKEFISMFVDEASITVQLNHPNICQLYELGRLDGSYFIVMEHIAGQDLLAFQNYFRVNGSIMRPAQAAYIVSQIARGIDYAHHKESDDGTPLGIVHRDISPQNILVSYNGEVKVIDFGIARAKNRRQQTQVGVLKGKFGYMSPEQVSDSRVDGQSDVFATGIMLWELLTNRRLFYAKKSNDTLKLVQNAPIKAPSELVSSVPPELDAITMKALRRDRAYRYKNGRELAEDLERWLASESEPYGEKELAEWICESFSRDLKVEHEKRRLFRKFTSNEDVLEYQRVHGVPTTTNDGVERRRLTSDEFNHYKETVSQRKSMEDILAEQGIDSVRKAVGRSSKRALPSTSEMTAIRTTDIPPPRQKRSKFAFALPLFVGSLLIAMAAAIIALAVGAFKEDTGVVVFSVEPAAASVSFGNRTVETTNGTARVTAPKGDVPVTISMAGYRDYRTVVHVGERETTTLVVQLEQRPSRDVALRVPDSWGSEVRIFLNGAERPIEGGEVTYVVDPLEMILVEVDRPGFFVKRKSITPSALEHFQLEALEFQPVATTVDLRSDPTASVVVDGERLGETSDSGLLIEDLDPFQSHSVTLESSVPGFQSLDFTLIFEGAYERSLTLPLPRIGREAIDNNPGGRLIIEGPAEQWYSLAVDGREIGLTTPLEDEGIALSSGNRLLTFRRGGDTWTHEVTVENGRTVRLRLPIDDMPAHPNSGAP